jgi:hypothetical protein
MSTGGNGSGGSAAGGSATGGSAAGGNGSGGGTDCNPPCGVGFDCCDNQCVNQANDINNCGSCGNVCQQDPPFCDNGTCDVPPGCVGQACIGTEYCCGNACCGLNELCCVVQAGPVGPPQCFMPVNGTCPPGNPGSACAAPDTPIATPSGERPIAELRAGDRVYSVDRGVVRAVPIRRVSRTAVSHHRVMRIALDNGAVLHVSAGHPAGDARLLGDLRAGDLLHGPQVIAASLVDYAHAATYDIEPDSDSATYFAAGALLGTTLRSNTTSVAGASLMAPTD